MNLNFWLDNLLKDYKVRVEKNENGDLILKSQNDGVIIQVNEMKLENQNVVWAKKLKKHKVVLRDCNNGKVVIEYETHNLNDLICKLFREMQNVRESEKDNELKKLREEYIKLNKIMETKFTS